MSPLEMRLREALEVGTASDQTVANLARGARARAAARRRHRFVGVGVAAVFTVGSALAAVVDDAGAPAEVPPTADEEPPQSERRATSGWHFARWRGVTVQVPNTWGSGALAQWCRRGPLLGTPVIERAARPRAGGCSDPELGYGVQFFDAGRSRSLESHDVRRPRPAEAGLYPPDSWVGVTCGGCDVAVRVVAPDPYVARYLLSSYDP